MNGKLEEQLAKIEAFARGGQHAPCSTCHRSGIVVMMVSEAEAATPACRPTHCHECGTVMQTIVHIIGDEETSSP